MGVKYITAIMYHYVRDLSQSKYPEIKGLTVDDFRNQLAYIIKHYHVVTAEEVINALDSTQDLPSNAALLTFDDGYIDHYKNVFPILLESKVRGLFFPSADAVEEGRIVDVNKIHFILAACADKSLIINTIFRFTDSCRHDFGLEANEDYYREHAVASRFDSAEVIFIKRMLQKALPEWLRNRIIDDLFKKFVTVDERAFSAELYVSPDQLRIMIENGMYVGSHGYDHYWLTGLSASQQVEEIDKSLAFMA
ncbi:MAG: polysaccharide deacetylase family protein, partial [Desulfomonilaceae bacterium]